MFVNIYHHIYFLFSFLKKLVKSEAEKLKRFFFSFLMFGFDQFAAEIAMFENNIVIYKFAQDLHFFVTGGDDENELIISTVLQGFFDAVGLLLR